MMKFLLSTAFLATVVAAQLHHSTASDECVVHASVRAEDLAPNQISHGELRIKVKQAHCANQIVSVALRLQLDEFGEVKHLRPGAVIPSIQKSDNQYRPDDFLGHSGISNETIYDYGPYDRAMSDSALWVVKAEKRMAWSTEVVLFENNPDFSEPMVTPFIVACPAVNYPPSVEGHRHVVGSRAVRRHGYAQLGYHYTAIVNFTDGRTVDLPAGYTTFVPTSPAPPPKTAFTWNATFTENKPGCEELPSEWLDTVKKCLPDELRSLFTAEVILEEGNVIQRGEPLKGTVSIHSTNGSTTMSDISINFATSNSYHWAIEQAGRGGDLHYRKLVCQGSGTRGLSIHSFPWVFQKDGGDNSSSRHRLAADNTHFDFELQIPQGAAPDFQSYFSSGSASLELRLGILYSEDVSACIDGDKYSRATLDSQRAKTAAKQAAHDEEQLWNSHSPVRERVETHKPVEPPIQYIRRLDLIATVPLVVLGETSARPVEHYLKPGLPSPIILVPETAGEFPVAQPEIVEEPFETTSARLMRSGGTYDPRDRALGEEADCDGERAPGGCAS
ncbi:hypothetical protein DFH09DRAFT_1178912 [Mycena vulgaris]|nr:hypothetical protein DFH09DRAFT_1178912 [Mycena vulgaris]